MPRPTKDGLYLNSSSPYWYCRFYTADGNLIRRSTGETDQDRARVVYNRIRILHQRKPDESTPVTVNTVLDLYYQHRGHELRSQRGYHDSRRALLRFWDHVEWHELSRKGGEYSVRAYVKHRKKTCKPSTINRELNVLSAAANLAEAEGISIDNPVTGNRPAEVRDNAFHYLTIPQAQELIDAAKGSYSTATSPHLHDYLVIALGTGMRMTEILSLRVQDIHLHQEEIHLPTSKNAKGHRVPMNVSVLGAIHSRIAWAKLHQSEWLFYSHRSGERLKCIRGQFINACKRAGIHVTEGKLRGIRLHDTRHSSASWLVQAGTPLQQVGDLLNHSNLKTTMRYAHLAPDARKGTVDRLPKL